MERRQILKDFSADDARPSQTTDEGLQRGDKNCFETELRTKVGWYLYSLDCWRSDVKT